MSAPRNINTIKIYRGDKCVHSITAGRARNSITVRRECREWIRNKVHKNGFNNYSWVGYASSGEIVAGEKTQKIYIKWENYKGGDSARD